MSERGREWLARLEGGHRLKAYLCPAGVWTIGAGIARYSSAKGARVKPGDTLASREEAEALFARVLKSYESGVDALTRDDLAQYEFDALVSFAYNVGVQALASSTLIRRVNERAEQEEIARQFARWVYADGEVLQGLVLRRRAEAYCYAGKGYFAYDEIRKEVA